jgi:nucleotidyltransferase substrate binding protein (TIGR01987 family)
MKTTICEGEIDISSLLKAKAMLDEALTIAKSPLEKTGTIQCFEYCYELAWKTMKRILHYRGLTPCTPRDTFRDAVNSGLIADPEVWFAFMAKRKLTVHTYRIDLAQEIFDFLPSFQSELNTFIATITCL